ncbi:MAG: glutaredoxin family protein [Thermoplasmata archaeon]
MMKNKSKIYLYALSTCGHCKRMKQYLDEKGISYDFAYVDLLTGEKRESAINEVKKCNPRISFPTLIIGDKIIIGFDEEKLKEVFG